jgi:hypothetical protein
LDRHYNKGDDKEEVDNSTHRVGADHFQRPQNQQNDTDSPQDVKILYDADSHDKTASFWIGLAPVINRPEFIQGQGVALWWLSIE